MKKKIETNFIGYRAVFCDIYDYRFWRSKPAFVVQEVSSKIEHRLFRKPIKTIQYDILKIFYIEDDTPEGWQDTKEKALLCLDMYIEHGKFKTEVQK